MTTDQDAAVPRWSSKSIHVRRVLAQIKAGKLREPEQLVEWDATHGKHLFDWSDPEAAQAWRVHQARRFFTSFRTLLDGLRVRSFISVMKDDESGERVYMTAQEISNAPSLRLKVIQDVTKRIEMLTRELKLWNLTTKERTEIMKKVEALLNE